MANPPFEMEGLDHLVIRCVDLAAMKRFYCDVLGCTVDRHNAELDLLQLRAGRQLIDLVTVDGVLGRKGGAAPGPEGRNLDHFAIRIDRFDDAALHAYICVATFVSARYALPSGVTSAAAGRSRFEQK